MTRKPDLPTSIEAERFVLGSALNYQELMHAVRPLLEPSMFSIERHRKAWKAACELYDSGKVVDTGSVFLLFQQWGNAASDDLSYLWELDTGLPHLLNVDRYVETVLEKHALRSLMDSADHAIKRCMVGDSAQAVSSELSERLMGLTPKKAGTGLRSAAEV